MIDPWGSGTRNGGMRPEYVGWGGPRADSTPYDDAIRIQGKLYRYGIGALANSRLEVKIEEKYLTFTAEVGLDDSTKNMGAKVRFEVYGDGELLHASKVLGFNQGSETISVNVKGVKVLELIVRQMTGDSSPTVVAWANAALL